MNTWEPYGNSGMRYMENCDVRGGETDNPNPWVIVENAGMDNENIVIDMPTWTGAEMWIHKNGDHYEKLDIMKRRDDGTLTAEY